MGCFCSDRIFATVSLQKEITHCSTFKKLKSWMK
nr:MAG TPA: hypothetical protein [Caudoviricetes sp.]